MCATPCPKCKKVLGALAGDEAAHAAFARAAIGTPAIVAGCFARGGGKKGLDIHWRTRASGKRSRCFAHSGMKNAGTVDGPPALVVKASKECSLAMADVAVPAEVVAEPTEVVAMPAPVTKVPGPFHPTVVVVGIIGTEVGDCGRSCEEHASYCGEVMAKDVVVCLQKVQIQVEGQEEMAIAAYWVIESVNCCHVDMFPCHMVRHAHATMERWRKSPMF